MLCLLVLTCLPLAWGWHPYVVVSDSMGPLIRRGDVVVSEPFHGGRLKVGDVVTVSPAPARPGQPAERPVTHRIAEMLPDGQIRTKGDANPGMDTRVIRAGDVEARAKLVVPLVGWPAVLPPVGKVVLAVLAAVLMLVGIRGRPAPPGPPGGRAVIPRQRRPARSRTRRAAASGFVAVGLVGVATLGTTPTASVFTGATSTANNRWTMGSSYYATSVQNTGPVSYWRMGDGGTSAADSVTATGATLTLSNPTVYTRGVPGAIKDDADTATTFTNSGGTFGFGSTASSTGNPKLTIAGPLSVGAWLKVPASPIQSATTRVLFRASGTSNINYLMSWGPGAGATQTDMRFLLDTVAAGGGTNRTTAAGAYPYAGGGWHFVVGTCDSTGTVRLYIDGNQLGATAVTGGYAAPAGATSQATTVSLNSGGLTDGGVDEVAIWDKALTPAQISALYAAGT